MFETLLTTPAIAYILLGFLGLEAILLLLIWKYKTTGLPPLQILSFLGAGACFAVALGFALAGASSSFLGAALVAAFFFHVLDIYLRWIY
jgi:hypothetical protein